MDTNEKVLCNAKIKCKWTLLSGFLVLLWWGAESLMHWIEGPRKYLGHYKNVIWGVIIYDTESGSDRFFKFFGLTLITIGIFIIPLLLKLIPNYLAKRNKLILTERQINCQLKTLFSTKKIKIPIEKIDNIMTINSLWDKLRSGQTILILSDSKTIKIHYVHNAQEFVGSTLERINEIKLSHY